MDEFAEHPLQTLVRSDCFYHQVETTLNDPNETDSKGYTLLHLAAESPEINSRIFQFLLDSGANVDSITQQGHTPLHFAVSSRKLDSVVALINAGASVNSKDFLGRTALHFAVGSRWSHPPIPGQACDLLILEKLLRHPEIQLDPRDHLGETPLMWAVKEMHLNAVRTLLKRFANPNISDIDNQTPLHKALYSRNLKNAIVFALLLNGAGIYCKENSGQTPVDLILRRVHQDGRFPFASRCLWLIALRYKVKKSLKRKLNKVPTLAQEFETYCKEVRLMSRVAMCCKHTLHDFAYDCIHLEAGDAIFVVTVEMLLSGFFTEYLDMLLPRMSMLQLRSAFSRISGVWFGPDDDTFFNKSHIYLFSVIAFLYENNDHLEKPICEIKKYLMNLSKD